MADMHDFLNPDAEKARAVNPMYSPNSYTPCYIKAGERIPVQVESRDMEVALIKAYDYGYESLNDEGRQLVQRFIDDAVLRLSGKIE